MTDAAASREDEAISTRERILREASHLFAARGYHGSSTRDIASAVGIRQPSLFHHFSNKQAILQELLSYSLEDSVVVAEYLVGADGSAAARLYRFLVEDVRYLTDSPYDLRSIFSGDLLSDDEFAFWGEMSRRLDRAVSDLVRQGIAAGEFVPLDVDFVGRAVAGLQIETIRERSLGEELPAERPMRTAVFVVRALLVEPGRLEDVADEAGTIEGLPVYRDAASD